MIAREREQATNNLPTQERFAKGDIRIHWPEDDNRSTIPTARAQGAKTAIQRLRDQHLIDDSQYAACCALQAMWASNINSVVTRIRIATWQNSGVPRGDSTWQSRIEHLLHRQWCYNFLRNPDNGIATEDLNKLERVICSEQPIRTVMRGRHDSQIDRFIRLVDRLELVLKTMPSCN